MMPRCVWRTGRWQRPARRACERAATKAPRFRVVNPAATLLQIAVRIGSLGSPPGLIARDRCRLPGLRESRKQEALIALGQVVGASGGASAILNKASLLGGPLDGVAVGDLVRDTLSILPARDQAAGQCGGAEVRAASPHTSPKASWVMVPSVGEGDLCSTP